VLGLVGPTVTRFYTSIVSLNTLSARVYYGSNLRAIADISVNMRCENAVTNPDSPGIYIDFDFSVFVPGLDGLVPIYPTRGLRKQATLKLETACESRAFATCSDSNQQKTYRFATPITFTVSNASAGLTSWNPALTFDNSVGDQSRVTPCFNQLVDNFAATFRITSRPSCNNVACSCNAVLGGMRVALGNLKQVSTPTPSSYEVSSSLVDTVWMYDRIDETVYWEGPFGFYEYDQKDPDGEQNGDGKLTRLLWRQRAELYCDLIDGVSQWFVLFTSFRTIYDNDGTITHYSYDQWVGKIDCYKACEDVGNDINAGDSLPMGEPYDIEYIGRTTQPGYLECEPPPRITISFKQIITC
jgi:hypothetical protein